MCGLCGTLGGRGHWSDSAEAPEAFAGRVEKHTWQRERQGRVRLVNRVLRHYGLSLADWEASSYILRNRTGQTVMVANLSELWPAAERMIKRPCDPLDPELLAALAAAPTH